VDSAARLGLSHPSAASGLLQADDDRLWIVNGNGESLLLQGALL
jgi:hypothetical protein